MPLASSYIQASVTDAATGSSYLAGDFIGTGTFGDRILTSTNDSPDGFILKHDAQGNILWAKQISGTSSSEKPSGLALDAAGNLYVAGRTSSPISFDAETVFNPGSGVSTIYVAKISPTGTVLWVRGVGTAASSNDVLTSPAISVNSTGTVYVAAELKGRASFGATQLENSAGIGPVLLQLIPDGTVRWARAATIQTAANVMTGADSSYGLSVDAAGTPYLGGSFSGSLGFDSRIVTAPVNLRSAFIAHYDTQGNVLWATQSAASSRGHVNFGGIVTDAAGSTYITGSFGDFYATDAGVSFGPYALSSKGATDVFLVRYDATGTPQWATGFGSDKVDLGHAVALSPNGDVLVAGRLNSTAIIAPGMVLTGPNSLYSFVVSMTNQGTARWVQQTGGSSSIATGVSTDNAGNVYVRGQAGYDTTFGSLPGTPLAGTSFAARLSSSVLSTHNRNETQALTLYPSPARGTAEVKIGSLPKGTVLHLSDATGRIVHQQTVSSEVAQLSLPGLHAGLYALKATAPNGKYYTGRLVVE